MLLRRIWPRRKSTCFSSKSGCNVSDDVHSMWALFYHATCKRLVLVRGHKDSIARGNEANIQRSALKIVSDPVLPECINVSINAHLNLDRILSLVLPLAKPCRVSDKETRGHEAGFYRSRTIQKAPDCQPHHHCTIHVFIPDHLKQFLGCVCVTSRFR
ncbi:uncharacterized protein J3R85_017719 [Psidium guajava]|nr:uncharacterized protein J3R85_017719 [Psidium guajava]